MNLTTIWLRSSKPKLNDKQSADPRCFYFFVLVFFVLFYYFAMWETRFLRKRFSTPTEARYYSSHTQHTKQYDWHLCPLNVLKLNLIVLILICRLQCRKSQVAVLLRAILRQFVWNKKKKLFVCSHFRIR